MTNSLTNTARARLACAPETGSNTKANLAHHTHERIARRPSWQTGWMEKWRQLLVVIRASGWPSPSASRRKARMSRFDRSNKAGADEAAAGIQKLGRKVAGFQCDVGRVADGQKFIADAVAQFGKIDILVNNAGLERRADFWDATEEDYDAVLNVNLKGLFFITQAFANHRMQAKAGGKIINISSVHEELPFPHFTSYCASKGGVK